MKENVTVKEKFLIPELKLTQVSDIKYDKLPRVGNSSDAVRIFSAYIAENDLLTQISVNEFAFVLYLYKQNRVLGITVLSVGGYDSTIMDVRMMYSIALKIGASSTIIAHNHPSQNLRPSEADLKMAKQIREGGNLLGMPNLDFMILTSSSGYFSFADEQMMADGGMMAKGGLMAHGLQVGDKIIEAIDANTIVVENPTMGRRTLNISSGHSMAKGGKMSFEALSDKVAKNYVGKSVPSKFQSEYGKTYDKAEAKTVGDKVAAKVYRLQQGK